MTTTRDTDPCTFTPRTVTAREVRSTDLLSIPGFLSIAVPITAVSVGESVTAIVTDCGTDEVPNDRFVSVLRRDS